MEDSRNIIKAIDALTQKAGGGVVDSKNITEAIDNLKAVYDQKAIGIDKTLTQEGVAADAKATGDEIASLNNKVESTVAGYTPTISGNSTVVVQNISFTYFRFGGMMLISGRFNLINKGDGTDFLRISLPTGFKVTTGSVGSYGTITPSVAIENKAFYVSMSMRGDTNADAIYVQYGEGGASIPYMQTGYHMIFAVIPVTKTA